MRTQESREYQQTKDFQCGLAFEVPMTNLPRGKFVASGTWSIDATTLRPQSRIELDRPGRAIARRNWRKQDWKWQPAKNGWLNSMVRESRRLTCRSRCCAKTIAALMSCPSPAASLMESGATTNPAAPWRPP